MADLADFAISAGDGTPIKVHTAFTDRCDGDLSRQADPTVVETRRRAVVDLPWVAVHQVHGTRIFETGSVGPGAVGPGAVDPGSVDDDVDLCARTLEVRADGVLTGRAGVVASVQVADCAPVLMWAPSARGAVVAAVHAGWRGLYAGVLSNAVAELEVRTGSVPRWSLGPCICATHYEFGEDDLEAMADRFGAGVRARTAQGSPALDLRAAVAAAMRDSGCAAAVGPTPVCTLDSNRHWSHRGDGTPSRQVGAIWWQYEAGGER
ncbi:MAG: laccase domain-containing protein [Microthrixaceae bacterium]